MVVAVGRWLRRAIFVATVAVRRRLRCGVVVPRFVGHRKRLYSSFVGIFFVVIFFVIRGVESEETPPSFTLRREVAEQVLPSIVREQQLNATPNRACNV